MYKNAFHILLVIPIFIWMWLVLVDRYIKHIPEKNPKIKTKHLSNCNVVYIYDPFQKLSILSKLISLCIAYWHKYIHTYLSIYLSIYIYLSRYIYANVNKYNLNNETFKIQLYFDSYKSSTDWQWNENCKNYIQLDQLKKIKWTKSRLKRKRKML